MGHLKGWSRIPFPATWSWWWWCSELLWWSLWWIEIKVMVAMRRIIKSKNYFMNFLHSRLCIKSWQRFSLNIQHFVRKLNFWQSFVRNCWMLLSPCVDPIKVPPSHNVAAFQKANQTFFYNFFSTTEEYEDMGHDFGRVRLKLYLIALDKTLCGC